MKARIALASSQQLVSGAYPEVPAQTQATAKTAMIGKAPIATMQAQPKMYGTGQPWWTTDNGIGVSTFVASTLPQVVTTSFGQIRQVAFGALRAEESKGSLHQFLKKLNRGSRFQGMKVNGPAVKPAIIHWETSTLKRQRWVRPKIS